MSRGCLRSGERKLQKKEQQHGEGQALARRNTEGCQTCLASTCDLASANYRKRNDGRARDRPSPYETQRSLMRMMRRFVVMQPQQIYPKIIGDVPPD